MAMLSILMAGAGMYSSGGDMSQDDQTASEKFLQKFGLSLDSYRRGINLSISQITLLKTNYILAGSTSKFFYFAFIDKPGIDTIVYQDFKRFGDFEPDNLKKQLESHYGDVYFVFKVPRVNVINMDSMVIQEHIQIYLKSLKTEKADSNMGNSEIAKEITLFRKDFPVEVVTAFIIMQFSSTPAHTSIVKVIKDTLSKYGIVGLRADDKEYSDELFANIKTYMHCCNFGIAVFERINEDDFNPNVSIEVGYMMGDKKPVCLLKDKTLKNLPSDLVGKLYKPFDPQDISTTLPLQLEKWLLDREFIHKIV